ncbi:hypothetical protein CF327_g7397 [Tilletia walkeri]|nr:hypothetical protein CF327_g7397 [Tilletia walkeri]
MRSRSFTLGAVGFVAVGFVRTQEWPLKKMRQAFQKARQAAAASATGGADSAGAPSIPLHTLDLSTIPLDQDAVDPLADFLSVDFGLDKLVLQN